MGAKAKLLVEEQIILTLMYLRQGLTFQVLGIVFGVSESTANDIFNYWQYLFRFAVYLNKKNGEDEEYLSKHRI